MLWMKLNHVNFSFDKSVYPQAWMKGHSNLASIWVTLLKIFEWSFYHSSGYLLCFRGSEDTAGATLEIVFSALKSMRPTTTISSKTKKHIETGRLMHN